MSRRYAAERSSTRPLAPAALSPRTAFGQSGPRSPAGTSARARAASGLRFEIRLATTRERGRLEALKVREVSGPDRRVDLQPAPQIGQRRLGIGDEILEAVDPHPLGPERLEIVPEAARVVGAAGVAPDHRPAVPGPVGLGLERLEERQRTPGRPGPGACTGRRPWRWDRATAPRSGPRPAPCASPVPPRRNRSRTGRCPPGTGCPAAAANSAS